MISVVVPFKNSEEWLGRCLESLRTQEGDFEFVIVNDNSDDGGREIAEKYAAEDERFRLFDNERGAGVSGARNTGLDHIRGEWFTFLDADDEMLPRAWRTFQHVLLEDADMYQLNHRRYHTAKNRETVRFANNGGLYGLDNLPVSWWDVWNKLLKTARFRAVRFDEGLQYGEDGMYVLECLTVCGEIRHAEYNDMTTRHRFDNKQSLSHIKKLEDLVKQNRAYELFVERQTDPRMKRVVCLELVKLWDKCAKLLETEMSSTS